MPLIVLGVDGIDWQFVDTHRADLPTLAGWPVLRPLKSIFPPDSIPAWTTIFTGTPPGEHGLLDSIDYLDKQPDKAATVAGEGLPGRTFWDALGAEGLRVCVVNPFLAYPAWDVNGVMVSGPVFVDKAPPSVTGIDPSELGKLPQLGGIVTFPTSKTMGPFVEETLATTAEQAEFGIQTIARVQPDFFFMNILTIDRLQHFAWRYCDRQDPTYPGENPHEESVLRAYAMVDEIARRFAEHGDVVLLSDHGFGRRCTRMVYVDEVLRRAGLVHEEAGRLRVLSRSYLLERAKKLTLQLAYRTAMEERAYAFGRRLPNRKAIKYSSFSSNADESLARLATLFGRNQHSGVQVTGDDPKVIEKVIATLSALRDPSTGEGVFEWIRRREEVVQGSASDRYPAVLFKLREGYGVDFGLYGGIFGPDVNHRRISGGHKPLGVIASSKPVEPPTSIEGAYAFLLSIARNRADSPGK